MGNENKKFNVFINYASEDKDFAIIVYEKLVSEGFSVWMDIERLLPGDDWKYEIKKAIRNCNAFMCLMSSRSVNKRGFVQKEIKEALDVLDQIPPGQNFLIPVRIDDCYPSHPDIPEKQWVDLFPDINKGIDKIIFSLSNAAKRSNPILPKEVPSFKTNALTIKTLEVILCEILEKWSGCDSTGDNSYNKNISELSVKIGNGVGLDKEKLEELRVGALLLDIGKLTIPQNILLKNGKLTPDEWIAFRAHTENGEKILMQAELPELIPACRIARSHHEKWNGKGYPDGLKGKHIPLEARIVAISNVYYAFISKRPYKSAFSKEKTLKIMEEESGEQFDPELLKLFFGIVKNI